jgi:DnaK suppressor protein
MPQKRQNAVQARYFRPLTAVNLWRRRGSRIALYMCIMQQMKTRKDALAALRVSLMAARDRMAATNSATRQALAVPENLAVEDQVPLLHEQHVALSRHSHDRHTLDLIDAALDRLDRNEYGICQECDGEISLKRLIALPWALRCKTCQEGYERHSTARASGVPAAFAARN